MEVLLAEARLRTPSPIPAHNRSVALPYCLLVVSVLAAEASQTPHETLHAEPRAGRTSRKAKPCPRADRTLWPLREYGLSGRGPQRRPTWAPCSCGGASSTVSKPAAARGHAREPLDHPIRGSKRPDFGSAPGRPRAATQHPPLPACAATGIGTALGHIMLERQYRVDGCGASAERSPASRRKDPAPVCYCSRAAGWEAPASACHR